MNKLKQLRKENKKTQDELAKYLHISQSNYGKYELQEIEPNIDTLTKLADYYNVSLDYLIGRDYKNEFAYLTDNEKIILNSFRQMNKDNQIKFIAHAQGILIAQN